jgi:uroporphyrinogen III methyltransferase/synthase
VRELARVRIAAIGPETAAQLTRRLLRAAIVPADYRAEGLIAALAGEELRGRRILVPRAAGARPVLPEELRRRGAIVDEVAAYRTVMPPDADVSGLRAAIEAGALDALTFTSSSTVRNFVTLLGGTSLGPRPPVIACIGPVTAETAREIGLQVDVVAVEYTAAALARALVDHFRGAPA